MYFCLNAVTREAGVPEAVLIRGAIPLQTPISTKKWLKVEPDSKKWNRIMSGPGKLCNVLEIDKTLNDFSLQGNEIWIEEGIKISTKEIVKSPRIGIDYTLNDPAGSHQWPLRFLWKPLGTINNSKVNKNENIFRYYENNRQNSARQNAKNRKKSSGRNSPKARIF